jgi:cytochrome oxidase Cu insertion factor (SCO1/SenC/PrrC family)
VQIRYSKYSNQSATVRNALLVIVTLFLASSISLAHDKESHQSQPKAAKTTAAAGTEATARRNSPWGKNYFPNTILVTQDGEQRRFFDDLIKDKVVAINFIYTSCDDSCPLETARMRRVYEILGDRVGKDIFFYSISIDPKNDTPEVLKAYMKKFKIGPHWTFLTGNEQEIITLRRKFGLYLEEIQNNKNNPDDHNLNLIIGNQASGRWMKRSPFENPYVLASHLGDWLHNWKGKPKTDNKYANAPKIRQMSAGETLFRTRCSSCHEFGKNGVGPDLLGVVKSRDRLWLQRWLKAPDVLLAEKDPLAVALLEKYKIPMPNMRLTDKDIKDLIVFMEAEDKRLKS